jgi:hypothetical protein
MEALQERAEACGMSITMLLRKSLELQEREFSKTSLLRA